MSKVYNKIVQSNTEPSKNDVWLKDGQMKTFGKEGWKPIGGGSSLDANTPIKETLTGDELIPVFDGENKMVNVSSIIKNSPQIVKSLEDIDNLNLAAGTFFSVASNNKKISKFEELYQITENDYVVEENRIKLDNLTIIDKIIFNLGQNIVTGNYYDFSIANESACIGDINNIIEISFSIVNDKITITTTTNNGQNTIFSDKIRYLTQEVSDNINNILEKETFYYLGNSSFNNPSEGMINYLNKIFIIYTGTEKNIAYIKKWEGIEKIATDSDIKNINSIITNKKDKLTIKQYDVANNSNIYIRDNEYAIITYNGEIIEGNEPSCSITIGYANHYPTRTTQKALIHNVSYIYVDESYNNNVVWKNGEVIEELDPNMYYILNAEIINIDGTTDGIICFVTITPFKSV